MIGKLMIKNNKTLILPRFEFVKWFFDSVLPLICHYKKFLVAILLNYLKIFSNTFTESSSMSLVA